MPATAPSDDDAWSFAHDIADVVARCVPVWNELRGASLLITGGTGFIGRWLLASLAAANDRHTLGVTATILTRDPERFRQRAPELASHPAFRLAAGDVRDVAVPAGDFSHVIHGAAEASAAVNEADPARMFDTIVAGTRHVLDLAVARRPKRVLFLSSGAVYGRQPWEIEHVAEDFTGAPDLTDPRATYAEAKRAAEMLCTIYGKQFGLTIAVARIFTLLGPYLPLDTHFAVGNFIRDAMSGRPVTVNSDGRACRSYLYGSDLAVWLWHMLVRAEPGRPYNVGSNESVSIRDLAACVSRIVGSGGVDIRGKADTGWNPGRYVPDTELIARDLGLRRAVSLDEAIRRTALWNGWKGR